MALVLTSLLAAGCTAGDADAMTLDDLRVLDEQFQQGGSELQAVVADLDQLASVAAIIDDAVWQAPLPVVAGETPGNPDWLDVDGWEATADRELRALLTEEQYEALRDVVENLS
jgi:hypothetical protein